MNESGLRRSAILLAQLKAEVAEQVFDALDVATAIRLRDRMAALSDADLAERSAVIAEFDAQAQAHVHVPPEPELQPNDDAFGQLAMLGPREAAAALENEPPRAIAAMLTQIDVAAARAIAEHLPPATRARVRGCLGDNRVLERDTLDQLELALEEILAQRDSTRSMVAAPDRVDETARALFDRLGRSRDTPENFSELAGFDDGRLRELFDDVDRSLLVAALKAADPRIEARFISVLDEEEAETLRAQLLLCPPLRVAEIEAAQAAILDAARRQDVSEERA